MSHIRWSRINPAVSRDRRTLGKKETRRGEKMEGRQIEQSDQNSRGGKSSPMGRTESYRIQTQKDRRAEGQKGWKVEQRQGCQKRRRSIALGPDYKEYPDHGYIQSSALWHGLPVHEQEYMFSRANPGMRTDEKGMGDRTSGDFSRIPCLRVKSKVTS